MVSEQGYTMDPAEIAPVQALKDNPPSTVAKLNATGYRWVGELADFNFTIRYRPEKKRSLPVEGLDNKQQSKQKKKTRTKERRQEEALQEATDTDSDEEGALVWRSPRLRIREESRAQVHTPEPELEQQLDQPQAVDSHHHDDQATAAEDGQLAAAGEADQEQLSDNPSEEDAPQQRGRDSDVQWSTSATHIYPQRERRRPQVLSYHQLGHPTVRPVGMDCIEVSVPPTCSQRLWRPWASDTTQAAY
uniref:Uncharacterized protein n=1 Tax=Knipowitschia caucasica TaxID=637954 RepID=A0AAV2JYX0_KNICA